MTRRLLLPLAAAAFLLVLAAPAAAQQEPYIEHRVLWVPSKQPQQEIDLGDDGRGQMDTEIGFRVVGQVTCASRAAFSLESMIWNPSPPWAGASLFDESERRAEFSLPAGTHEDTPWQTKPAATLAMSWDMESRPADPTFTYEVRVEYARLVPETQDCEPPLTTREQSALSAFLKASAPPPEDAPQDADGGDNGQGAPAPALVFAVVALGAALVLARRR